MNRDAAKQFVLQNARPIDLAVYKYFFENGSNKTVIEELLKYQNEDGGFGNGLQPDYWNPNSSNHYTFSRRCSYTRFRDCKRYCAISGIPRYLWQLF